MNEQNINTLVNDLKTAISDIGELLERKRSHFQEMGIDTEKLGQILTGRNANPRLRAQVLQELDSMDRDLSERMALLEPSRRISTIEHMVANVQTV